MKSLTLYHSSGLTNSVKAAKLAQPRQSVLSRQRTTKESLSQNMTSRHSHSVGAPPADAVGQEQAYVDMLYRLLDQARERTGQALAQTLGRGGQGGTFQARLERDFTATEQSRRLAQLNAVERGLVFGRTDGGEPGSPDDPDDPEAREPG